MKKNNQIYWIIGMIILFVFLAKSGVFTFMAVVNPDFTTDNLLSYYSFDVDAKDDYPILDSDGIINGNAGLIDGKINKAISFDGVDNYIEIDDSEQLKTSSISIAYWLNINLLSQTYPKIIETSNNDCLAYGFTLLPDNKITFDIDTCTSGTTTSTTTLELDKYYFIVGTYDGSEAKLYINGILEDSSIIDKIITYDLNPVFIGAGHDANGLPIEFLNGEIDEVSFYDAVLIQGRITSLYNGLSYLKEEPTPEPVVDIQYEIRYVCENGNRVDDPSKCQTITETVEYICSDGAIVTSADQCILPSHIPTYIWILGGIGGALFLYSIFGGKKNGTK